MPVQNFGIILIVTTVCYDKLEKTFNSLALTFHLKCLQAGKLSIINYN